MNREHPKRGRLAVGDMRDGIMTAYQLEGMADKKHLLLSRRPRRSNSSIKLLNGIQPPEVNSLPFTPLTVQRTAGTAAGNINVVGKIGHLLTDAYLELIVVQRDAMLGPILGQQFPDTAHTLIRVPFIEVQNHYYYLPFDSHRVQIYKNSRHLPAPLPDTGAVLPYRRSYVRTKHDLTGTQDQLLIFYIQPLKKVRPAFFFQKVFLIAWISL